MSPLKLKAGALQISLFVAVIIALLLATFILLIDTHNRFNLQSDLLVKTINKANQQFDYLLTEDPNKNDSIYRVSEQSPNILTTLFSEYWGVFEKVNVTSKLNSLNTNKSALIGGGSFEDSKIALYLKDNNKPLVLVGHAKIEGDAYLPRRGVKPGQISGQYYHNQQLIYGKIKESEKFPEIDSDLKDYLSQLINTDQFKNHSEITSIEEGSYFENSFFDSKKVFYSTSDLILEGIKITGHFIIKSDSKITVTSSATLTDVILIAPEIEIENKVFGTFQAIVSKRITVGKGCELSYPSALVLMNNSADQENDYNPQIIIEPNSTIKGPVVYIGQNKTKNFDPNINVSDGSKVYGQIYCKANLDLQGVVYGSAITSNFVTKYEGTLYQNHLFNGKILPKELPDDYGGLQLDHSTKRVAKWLY